MGELQLGEQSSSATPGSAVVTVWPDQTAEPQLRMKTDTGFVKNLNTIVNFSTASQAPAATTRTYITGSQIAFSGQRLQIGTVMEWQFNMTKTGAGTALSTIDICYGTAGTSADTARVSFTKPAGTAVIDEGKVSIFAISRGPLSGSGIVSGHMTVTHNLSATGHMVIPCADVDIQSSAFDVTTPTFAGVCITTGASDAITIQNVFARAWNL
jgi:hypothetical protein